MPFNWLDYTVIGAYVAIMVIVGYFSKKRGQADLEDYFTGGKNLPWWLIGVSMVATTFAADTPLAVTGIVATEGIAGNWIWWNFMFSGLITVFVYAKLWKRADVITDVEFIAIRYTGKPARILRGFRALYLAFPINCIILGWVTVGMAKILTVLTGAGQWEVIVIMYVMIGLYIAFSGLWGVIVTDFIQFILAMFGTIMLAWYAVDFAGGLDRLQTDLIKLYGEGHSILSINPLTSPDIAIATALVWAGMMWWASWYPGAEPGGGGYIAQRMFSAKDETNAVGGTLSFNVAHFALRPWPRILVALVALVVYMMRWFWWRINAWSEIAAMSAAAIGSFLAPALGFDDFASKMIFTTIFASIIWVAVTFLTKPDNEETLQTFFDRVKPGGPGWNRFAAAGESTDSLLPGLGYAAISAVSIIAFLYGMGQIFFDSALYGTGAFAVGIAGIWFVIRKL